MLQRINECRLARDSAACDRVAVEQLSPTYCGSIDRTLAYAARHTIASAAAPALIVLDDVHVRLGLAYTATGAVLPAERPSDRWVQLMRALFKFDHHERARWSSVRDAPDAWKPPARGVQHLVKATSSEQRKALRKLLTHGASWLLAESSRAEEQVALAARVHRGARRPFALIPADAVRALWSVGHHAGRTLLSCADAETGPLLLSAATDPLRRLRCRATRWDATCDIIHPRTPECRPLQPHRRTRHGTA